MNRLLAPRVRALRDRLLLQEDLNFLLTNRIPRIALTRAMGWLSKVRQPAVVAVAMAVWRWFGGIDLRDAKKQRFDSLHDCFTRELVPGARPIDTDAGVLVSPCDAIVGACGRVEDATVWQAKGFPYTLHDLSDDDQLERYRGGCYVTLRLTAGMYHRFHAPADMVIDGVRYMSGDTWNVNPVALKRVEKLFCKNERAVVACRLQGSSHPITLVPVAAVLVASMRLHCIDVLLHLRYRGPAQIACHAPVARGEELGWFEHGSTIIVFAPPGFDLCSGIAPGTPIRMGQRLLQLPCCA